MSKFDAEQAQLEHSISESLFKTSFQKQQNRIEQAYFEHVLNTCGTPVRFPPREYFNFPVRPETTVPTGCPSCNRMLHLTNSRLAVPKRSNALNHTN